MFRSARAQGELSLATILLYAAPMGGVGFMFFFVGSYLMKFATDVLLVAPATMGAILAASRLWDAISDPLAGHLSDRTRTRLGRRRPWFLAGALPVGAAFVLLFGPPVWLEGTGLALWIGAAVLLFYTALTVVMMPHDSLGAELSLRYADRNRIFGWRRVFFGVGSLFVFAALSWVAAGGDARSRTLLVAGGAAALTSVLFLVTGVAVRERPENWGRGGASVAGSLADVARNPHARLLIGVFFLQQLAVGSLVTSMAFYTDYVVGSAEALGILLGAFFVSSIAAVPVWVALGRRFEKKPLALLAMVTVGATLSSMLVLGRGDLAWLVAVAAVGGAAGAGLDVIFPSIQADVIDYDEYRTHERKEGVYFAVWALAAKSAGALAGALIGALLALSGFAPNTEQSAPALLAIRAAAGGVPLVCYAAGTLLFLRFGLDRRAHAEIARELAARSATRDGDPGRTP